MQLVAAQAQYIYLESGSRLWNVIVGDIVGQELLRYKSLHGHRWIPLTKASDVELWCFLWSATENTVE